MGFLSAKIIMSIVGILILLHMILYLNTEKNSMSIHRYVQQQRSFFRDTKAVVFL